MATVGIKIFKHHKKADGTYNVKIRVTHKGANHYLDTPHFVSDKQLKKNYSIKDGGMPSSMKQPLPTVT